MANTPLLGLLLPSTGTLDGTWGTAVNTQITSLIDSAIAGTTTLTTDANVVLTDTSEAPNQSRQAIILCTGARTVQRTVVVPARSKTYIVINATTGGYGVLVDAGGSGVTVPAGKSCVVAWDGSNVVAASDYIPNAKIDSLALTNALSVPNGGTGANTLTGLVKGNGTSAMTAVAAPTGAVVGTTDTQTLTGKTINGPDNTLTNIANASLANSAITINGNAVSLGGSTTVTATASSALTIGTGLSGTSYNGSAPVTIAIDSTVATLTGTQTLTNKTINGSNNTLSNIANASLVNSGVTVNGTAISLGGTGSVTATTTNALTVGSGLQLDSGTTFDGSAAKTLSLATDVVTLTGTQTLTNKTLTSPSISTITNTGTITLPTATTTLVGTDTTNTLTNKTINASNNTLSNIANASLTNSSVTVNGSAISLGGTATVTANTTNSLTVGSGLLLNSGTTFNGSAARTITVDSSVATLTGTQTLTNKRITPRVSSVSTTATLTPNSDAFDQVEVTAQSSNFSVAAPTGSPTDGQKLVLRINDNGTSRSITGWDSAYRTVGTVLPTATVANKVTYIGCIYNTFASKWDVVAVATQI